MHSWKHSLYITALALFTLLQVSPAAARTHVVVGSGIVTGDPYYQAYPYPYHAPYYAYPYRHYGYRHYAYPPAPPYPYVYPAQPVPAPVYAQPAPARSDAYYNDNQGAYCREYTHDVTVAGRRQQGYGHACMQSDGQWHIID